jgi:hypothetical protein
MLAQAEPLACAGATGAIAVEELANNTFYYLKSCATTGRQVVINLWSRNPLPEPVERLVELSTYFPDAGVFAAIRAVATSTARPAPERLHALRVLFAFAFRTHRVPVYEDLIQPRIGGLPYSVSSRGSLHAGPPVRTSQPIGPAHLASLAQLLYDLRYSGDDPTVRGAAERLRQTLAGARITDTPIPPGAVHLVGGCRGRVTFWSTADIGIKVQFRVLGDSNTYTQFLRGEWGEGDGRQTRVLPAGTVVITFEGREVARLTDRTAACNP